MLVEPLESPGENQHEGWDEALSYATKLNGEAVFDMSLARRNASILNGKSMISHYKKTGTTICGVVCANGIVLAADTRSTADQMVCDKYCEKLHRLADNVWCAGAGIAGDLEHQTRSMACQLELLRLQSRRMPRQATAVNRFADTLFKYQGHLVCALIVGGVDATGCHLTEISPAGHTTNAPFLTMGSGGYFAMAVMEANYRDGMTVEEGMELCADAIQAGILNDEGSGSQVDVVVLTTETPQKPKYIRGYRKPVQQDLPKPLDHLPLNKWVVPIEPNKNTGSIAE